MCGEKEFLADMIRGVWIVCCKALLWWIHAWTNGSLGE